MKNKALLIIDAQHDFINGSLPVKGAEEKMKKLAYHLHKHDGCYKLKIFTTDWHPFRHCSFKENGGIWPMHCLQNSKGAAIYDELLKAAYSTSGETIVLRKGDSENVEEYSIFDNFKSAQILKEILEANHIDELDICGIAGDYCVLNSIKGAIKELGKDKIKVLVEYSPSIGDGSELNDFIKDNKLKAEFEDNY